MLHHIKSVTYKTVGLRIPMLRRFIELCKGITGTSDICRAVLRRRRTFYLYQKLVQETCTRNLLGKFDAKFITVSCTTTTGQPITLHGNSWTVSVME